MYTDGPGINPFTELIPPDMVFTYAYDDDSNIESNSDNDYEPKDDNDNVLGAKELLGCTSVSYNLSEAKFFC